MIEVSPDAVKFEITIEEHGGTISVESALGAGSTFSITLQGLTPA